MLGVNVFWECCMLLLLFSLESGRCPHALLEATTDPQCVYSEVPGGCCHTGPQHHWSHACWVEREADLLCKLCCVCMFVSSCLSIIHDVTCTLNQCPLGSNGKCLIGLLRLVEQCRLKGFHTCNYLDSTAPNSSHQRTYLQWSSKCAGVWLHCRFSPSEACSQEVSIR